jgi:signal transduction histidine kinase
MAAPSILLVDSNANDRALAISLLERDLPNAAIAAAGDALVFADAIANEKPHVAIVAADLPWVSVSDLISALKRRSPQTAIVLFGVRAITPGLACEGLVRKNAAGFVSLPGIVKEVLERASRSREVKGPPASAPAVGGRPHQDMPTVGARAYQETPAVGGRPHQDMPNVGGRPHQETPAIGGRPHQDIPAAGARPHQEMRDVALVVSHDVQEPVQQIIRIARRAQASGGDQAATTGLQQAVECAERANTMLGRMVEYLTISGRDAAPAPVDLNTCLHDALDNLRSAIDDAGAEIRAVSLPTSFGDSHQLVHLFQNLIANAIKFRGQQRPVITISVEPRGEQWLLAFRDNGIGFAREFTDRIFELGKRLHTREEYSGSGIGLALCKRIVERHGGRIWAESRENGGSTFYVLLPRAPAEVARLA